MVAPPRVASFPPAAEGLSKTDWVGAASRMGRITRDTSAFQPQSPDPRQLERRHGGVNADIEPKDVQLEPLVHGEEEAGYAVERYLKPGAAGGRGKEHAAGQEVLADRVRGQVKAKLGDFTGNIRGERVTVRARPSTIFVRIRIAGDRGTDIVDHCVDTRSAPIEQDLRSGSEPVIVRAHTVDAKRRGAIGDAEAEHLVSGIALGPARLDREPSVH